MQYLFQLKKKFFLLKKMYNLHAYIRELKHIDKGLETVTFYALIILINLLKVANIFSLTLQCLLFVGPFSSHP